MGSKHGSVCWTELNTRDSGGAKSFYGELFGWNYSESTDGMPYTEMTVAGEEQPFGGTFQIPDDMGDVPPFWMTYFTVDNVEASTAKVKELGGQVRKEPADIPGVGRFSIVTDPAGATFALITLAMSDDHKG